MNIPEIKKLRKIDLTAIGMLAVLWPAVSYLISLKDNQLAFIADMAVAAAFIAFTALLIRRFGAVFLLCIISSLITIRIDNLGALGLSKVIILAAAGIVFELLALLLEIKVKNVPLDVVFGAAFSNASIPFTMRLLVPAAGDIMPYVWNFALMAFIVGIMGGLIAFLIWYNMKGLRWVIRFEYKV